MAVKTLLYQSRRKRKLSVGLGVVFPTGADSELIYDGARGA